MNGERDEDLLRRYRDASAAQSAAPGEQVRAAILAEGRAAAARHAAAASHTGIAPRRRWIYTLIGTASAAVLAGILVLPRFVTQPTPPTSTVPVAAPPIAADTQMARDKAVNEASPPVAQISPAPTATPTESANLRHADTPRPYTAESRAAAPAALANSADSAPLAQTSGGGAADSSGPSNQQRGEMRARRQISPVSLFTAVRDDDLTQLRQALQTGAAIESRDPQGRTPLLLATELGHEALVKELLDQGAEPDAADAAGRTPLQVARQAPRADLVELLQRAGARH